MKKILLVTLAASLLGLSSCFGPDHSEEYATPELFLSHITTTHPYITVKSTEVDCDAKQDYDLVIKDEILKVKEFKSASSISPATERHLSYMFLRSHSTAGPNYSNMYIYADGSLQIDYKAALGSLKSFYFTFDATEALALNAFVEERLKAVDQAEKAADEEGEASTNVENFCTLVTDMNRVGGSCYYEQVFHGFRDDGKLLDLIDSVDHAPSTDTYGGLSAVDYWHYRKFGEPEYDWQYSLYEDLKVVRLEHNFDFEIVGSWQTIRFFTIDANAGKSIFDLAKAMAQEQAK